MRSTPVAYVRDGERLAISGANAGLDRPPAWSLNLEADPRGKVEVGGHRFAVRARIVEGEERERLRERFRAQNPAADTTASLTSREIPVIVLEPEGRPERP